MGKYLDTTGLTHLWGKITEYVQGQVSGSSPGGEEPVLLAEITTAYLKSVIEAGESVFLSTIPDGVTIHQYPSDNTKRYQIKVGDYYVGADFRTSAGNIASAILCGGTAYDTVLNNLGYPWIAEVVISAISGSAINVIYKGDGGSNAVTTLREIPVDKKVVVASVSEGGTLSLGGDLSDGGELHVIVNNTGASGITVTLPDDSTLEIAAGAYGEVNVLYAGGTYYYKSA